MISHFGLQSHHFVGVKSRLPVYRDPKPVTYGRPVYGWPGHISSNSELIHRDGQMTFTLAVAFPR
jgi:hypothetical protein